MTDFICHFFATINVFRVKDFHCHWTCFHTKCSATYIQVLRHLQINLVKIIFSLMFKSIVSRILNILLNKNWTKKQKKWNAKCLVLATNEECKQTELILIRRYCITTRWRNNDSAKKNPKKTGPDCMIIRLP